MTDAVQVIAEVAKNKREHIRVALREYQHLDLIDLRVCIAPAFGEEPAVTTGRGFALRVGRLSQLIAALRQALAEAERRGLVQEGQE